jgi:hypothetical protein
VSSLEIKRSHGLLILYAKLYGAFEPVDKRKEKQLEIWSTNGLKGTEKPLR